MNESDLHRSEQLMHQIIRHIEQSQVISFADYMAKALYTPELGYYMQPEITIGQDFTTAPMQGPWLAQCLAQAWQSLAKQCDDQASVVEFGPGSGQLCHDFLLAAQHLDCLPERYELIDISPALKKLQQLTVSTLPDTLQQRIHWVDAPSEMQGLILANEFIDAWPVHQFALNPQLQERCVGLDEKNQLTWVYRDLLASQPLYQAVTALNLPAYKGFHSEVLLSLSDWFQDMARCMVRGAMLLIDYGMPQCAYYHPQRATGTVRCHSQHRAHDDPLLWPGLQDITAQVDFSAVKRAALQADWRIVGYAGQAEFMLNNGLQTKLVEQEALLTIQDRLQIKQLLMPTEMGEAFKVFGASRGLTLPWFDGIDRQASLEALWPVM